jgi:hypothetical protein
MEVSNSKEPEKHQAWEYCIIADFLGTTSRNKNPKLHAWDFC